MFLKDKYSASGVFDKFKARLVAGGDQQDKGLYENLSSPTAATSVLTVAAIVASEGRKLITIDIGRAFLNAGIAPTGIQVHMTQMLMQIDPTYQQYVEADGSMVVQLDKALYGCVEAAALWYCTPTFDRSLSTMGSWLIPMIRAYCTTLVLMESRSPSLFTSMIG